MCRCVISPSLPLNFTPNSIKQQSKQSIIADAKSKKGSSALCFSRLCEQLKDKCVLFVDCAPTRNQYDILAKTVKQICILDHHITNMQQLEGLPGAFFSPLLSGCGMAWYYFMSPEVKMPRAVKWIQRRDMWKNMDTCIFAFTSFVYDPYLSPPMLSTMHNYLTNEHAVFSALQQGFTLWELTQKKVTEHVLPHVNTLSWILPIPFLKAQKRECNDVSAATPILSIPINVLIFQDTSMPSQLASTSWIKSNNICTMMKNEEWRQMDPSILGHLIGLKHHLPVVIVYPSGKVSIRMSSDIAVKNKILLPLVEWYGGGGHSTAASFRIPSTLSTAKITFHEIDIWCSQQFIKQS